MSPSKSVESLHSQYRSEPPVTDAPVIAHQTEWFTETASEDIARQLKELGKLMSHPSTIDAASLSPLLVPDQFHCMPLRPSKLALVFHDAAFSVHRSESDHPTSQLYMLAEGLAKTLGELLQPASASHEIEPAFKVIRIEVRDNVCSTSIDYSLRAPMSNGNLQQNAVWKCDWHLGGNDTPPRLLSIAVSEYEEVFGRGKSGPLFADYTQSVLGENDSYRQQLAFGLDHWLDRIESRFGIDISGWQGLAIGDANGDGLDDVYLCQGGGLPNRLFLQNADGTARDISATSGVDYRDHTQSAVFADLDNDGDQDLVVATALGLLLLSNDGTAKFQLETAKSTPEAGPLSLAVADFDLDGDLDVFAACYAIRGAKIDERRFLGRPIPYHDANNGGRNALFRNDGAWQFSNVTKVVGMDQNNRRFSMAAAWEDYDNDGDQDLYVANDYGRNNLYRNEGGRFQDVAETSGVEDISAGMSASWGDFNRDGWMDLYVSNMFSSAGNRIAFQRQFHTEATNEVRESYQRHARGNSLFMNAGDGSFRDVSESAGVTMGRWAWGSRFVDVNNDGWEDLAVANGFITQTDPGDL